MTPERDEATLLLDELYRAVASKVRIRNIRAVAPNVSQWLARVLISRVAVPVGSVMPLTRGRLYNVEICKVWVSNADTLDDLRKRWKRVSHPHLCKLKIPVICDEKKAGNESAPSNTLTLVRGPRTEPYAHLVRADGIYDSLGDLEHEAHAILHRAAV